MSLDQENFLTRQVIFPIFKKDFIGRHKSIISNMSFGEYKVAVIGGGGVGKAILN
jgi:hypothetical protein